MNKARETWLGKHLMVRGKYAEKILSGTKTATIRRGKVKVVSKDILIHSGGKIIARAEIVDVKVKRFKDLTDDDARLDGFKNKEDLKKELRRIYPSIKEHDKVTIIKFRVVEHLDLTEDKRYRGKSAMEIAKMALENAEKIGLTEFEKNILAKLLEKRSLRATAREIYGTPLARRKIRNAIWSTLKKLEKEGII